MTTSVLQGRQVSHDDVNSPLEDLTEGQQRRISSSTTLDKHGGSGKQDTLASSALASQHPSSVHNLAPAKPSILAASEAFPPSFMMTSALSPPSNGPSAASYSVPPRPKPGRKPALDKPSEKRKAQNREAQRAFRERKVAHTDELRREIDQIKAVHDGALQENNTLKRKLHEMQEVQRQVEQQSQRQDHLIAQLQDQVRKYQEQEERWVRVEKMHLDTQQRLKQFEEASKRRDVFRRPSSSGFGQLPNEMALTSIQQHSPMTPPEHSPEEEEASCGDCARTGYCKCVEDFTVGLSTAPPASTSLSATAGRTRSYDNLEMDFTQSAPRPPAKLTHKPGCGFCEDSTDCPCQSDSTLNSTSVPLQPRADPMQISSIVEPGTCLKCQKDPEQRRFCIEMSSSRQLSQDLPDRTSNKRPRLEDGRPKTMTCNELYQASKHVVAESRRSGRSKPAEMESMFNSYIRKEAGQQNHTEARPGMRYRTYSTLELDGIETLAALSKSGST